MSHRQMKLIRWPEANRFLLVNILISIIFTGWVVIFHLPETLLIILIVPALVTPFHYPRWAFWTLILILQALEIWAAISLSTFSITSLSAIGVSFVALVVISEIIYLLTKNQSRISAAIAQSEEKYRTLVERAAEGILLVDEEGRIIDYNDSMEKMTGISREEAIGMEIWDYRLNLMPDSAKTPEVRERVKSELLDALKSGHSFLLGQPYEVTYRHKDSSTRISRQTMFAIRTDRGYRLGTLNLDVTQQRENEIALQENEERYKQIIENQGEGIAVVDTREVFTFANPAAEKIFGSPAGGIVDHSFFEFLENEQGEIVKKQTQLRQEGIRSSYELEITHLDGKKRTVLVTASPQYDAEGHYSGAMGIFFDITDRKRGEKLQNALYKISEAASTAQNLPDLFHSIHSIIGELIPARNFYITLFDPLSNTLSFPYFVDEYDQSPGMISFGHGMTEYIIRSGSPLLASPEVSERLEKSGEVQLIGTPSVDWVGVPLKNAEDSTFGALVVQTYTEGVRYTTQDLDVLSFVSRQVAMAVDRKRIEEAEREQRTLAEALRDTASALNSTLQFDEVLARILANLDKVVPHDASTLMLVDDGYFRVVRHFGFNEHGIPEPSPDLRIKLSDTPILLEMSETGQPILIEDVAREPRWVNPETKHWKGAYVGTAIRIRGETVGFININSFTTGFYKPIHADRLQAFANQAATAIENSRLYAQVRQQAITDSLTGLFNRSLFDVEMDRLQNSRGFPVSIMMIDVDGMKTTNDRLGHAAGDDLLRRAANILRANFRGEDIIARVGGDEFAILLPTTDYMAACEALERLKNGLVSHNAGYPDAPLNLSMGVSTGEMGSKLSEVWIQADASMYRDKVNKKGQEAGGILAR